MQSNKLNVLIYPMLSVHNINADSNYIIIKQICNELVKTNKYNFILLLDSKRPYVQGDLDKKVKILKIPFPQSKKHQVVYFNPNILDKIFKQYPIDIIWNNVVEQGHHFKYFQDIMIDHFRPKVFNYHHYIIHRSLDKITYYNPCKHIMLDQIMGSLLVDYNYFHTEYCYNMMMEEASDILNKTQLKKLKEISHINLGGYSKEIKTKEKYKIFTFIYNHRLSGYKRWKTTFEIFDKLYSEGYKFQVIFTAGDRGNLSTLEKKPYVVIKSLRRHSDYIEELSKCHANMINSIHETYCISIAESIMNNQIIIAPNRCTFPELLDKSYPYLFDDELEQEKKIKYILDNKVLEYKHKGKDKLLLTTHAKWIDNQFQNLKPSTEKDLIFNRIKKEKSKKAIKNYLDNINIVDMKSFRTFVYSLGYASQSFPIQKLQMLLKEFGFVFNITYDKYEKKI
jgi:glycosyltransferase involved in cell wall biosynthesis